MYVGQANCGHNTHFRNTRCCSLGEGDQEKTSMPSDKVNEPSKIISVSLYFIDNGKESLIDAANKKEVAQASKRTLTDESDYGEQE